MPPPQISPLTRAAYLFRNSETLKLRNSAPYPNQPASRYHASVRSNPSRNPVRHSNPVSRTKRETSQTQPEAINSFLRSTPKIPGRPVTRDINSAPQLNGTNNPDGNHTLHGRHPIAAATPDAHSPAVTTAAFATW